MKKKYFYITFLLTILFSLGVSAQEVKGQANNGQNPTIEGLNIYPNPVTADRVYITSKNSLAKEIEIYDVLGKKILQANISGKELNVSALTPGVYVIKIKEGDATATRKLIIR